jgi:hypothetical protein
MTSVEFLKAVSDFEKKAGEEVPRIIGHLKQEYPNREMVYLPNVSPKQKERNILIAMEPSFKWAKDEADGMAKVRKGFRNFFFSVEDMIVHFCAGRYLGGGYHITDVSKIAIKTKDAAAIREEAWMKQRDLLIEELKLIGTDDCQIIPIGESSPGGSGNWVQNNLHGHPLLKHFRFREPVLHYSWTASKHRTRAAVANAVGFKTFCSEWNPGDFVRNTNGCLNRMEDCEAVKESLRKRCSVRISESRLHLAFTYKTAFERIKG